MEKQRHPQTGGEAKPNDQRMQSFVPIEVVILSGIDQIKSSHPTNDSEAEDERRQFHLAPLRDRIRDSRNPEPETKKKVRCVGEVLRERGEKNDAKRDRRKPEPQPIDNRSKENKKEPTERQT